MSVGEVAALRLGDRDRVEVVSGEVTLFVQAAGGRRIPFVTAPAGLTVFGPLGEEELVLVGSHAPDAAVTTAGADPDWRDWASLIAAAASGDGWPARVVPLDAADSTLAPGEAVLNDAAETIWVQVTSGSARFVGNPGAVVAPLDGPIPLPPGAWLEAGLRCRIVAAPEREPGIGILTALAMRAVAQRWTQWERTRQARLGDRAAREQRAIVDAVSRLAASIAPETAQSLVPTAAAGAVALFRASGVRIDDDALRAAGELSVDPLRALAAAAAVNVRSLRLPADWHEREGQPFLVEVDDPQTRKVLPVVATWRRTKWIAIDATTDEPVDVELLRRQDALVVRELQPRLPSAPQRIVDLARLAFAGSRVDAAVVVTASVVAALLAYWSPKLLGRIAEMLATRAPASAFIALFVLLAALTTVGAMWTVVQALTLVRVRARSTARAAAAVWERLVRQNARWHADQDLGTRVNQATSVNAAAGGLTDQSVIAVLSLMTLVGSVSALAEAGPRALLLIGALLLVQAAIAVLLLRRTLRHLTASIDANAHATGRLIETLRAIGRLRVAGAESRAYLRWTQAQAGYFQAQQQIRVTTMLDGVVRAVWPSLVLVGLILTIGASQSAFGEFITAQSAATMATTTVATAIATLGTLAMTKRTIGRVTPVLAGVPESAGEGEDPGVLSGAFRLQDVRFAYPKGPAVIDGVTLDIAPGEHVAFVGTSGCGKTTLMRLLLGLEEPESGLITCDGKSLGALDRTALRQQIGSVLQSSRLLPGSLRHNVALGRSMTTAEVWAALEAASVADDVRAMPMGLDTVVTDASGVLSGGQMQRVLIARALAGNPRALVLDEATSALDNATQRAVIESLEALRITRVVVAHRLSTIRHANRIIVLDHGRIADQGTYDELIARPGIFRDLASRQLVEAST